MAEGIDIARLGRLIRTKRTNQNLSLRRLAETVDLKVPTLSRIERGDSRDIGGSTLVALCEWLGRDPEDFRVQKPKSITRHGKAVEQTPDIVDVYLRADKNLDEQTADNLSRFFRAAYEMAQKK